MTSLDVAVALILDQGRCFAQRRDRASRSFPGLWELPGGKLEPLETPRAALLRELLEELSWRPRRVTRLPVLRHAYPDFAVTLHPFLCEGPAAPRTTLSWGWFTRAEMARLAMPEASRGLLEQIP
jgi:8-oxo-dGTP diphosphatase